MNTRQSQSDAPASPFRIGSLQITLLLVLTFGSNFLSLVLPLFSMQIFDRVIPTANLSTLAWLGLIAISFLVCHLIVDGTRAAALSRIATCVEFRLLAFTATSGRARNGSRAGVFSEIDLIKTAISGTTAIAVLDAPFCIIFFLALYWLHPALGTIALLSPIPLSFVGFLCHRSTRKLRRQSAEHNARALSLLHQAQSLSDVSSASSTGRSLARFIASQRRIASELTLGAAEKQGWCDAALRGLRGILQVCVLAAAALLVINQDVNAGTIVAASMLFARALAPIERLLAVGPGLRNILLACSHLSAGKRAYDRRTIPVTLPNLGGDISLHDVSIRSDAGRAILDGVSLTLAEGTITVIVGPEGAGKSTLLRALVGAQDLTAGCIRIGGTNLKDIAPEQLGNEIGYLADDASLMSASAAQTITRMTDADPKAFLRAAIMAGAHEQIQLFPSGYQTLVGPGGHPTSAGERQRLLLARAFFGQPKLVVLDEPMTNLDEKGSGAVFTAIEDLKRSGSTIIIASRHPRFLYLMDRFLLIEDGKVKHDAVGDKIAEYSVPRMAANQ